MLKNRHYTIGFKKFLQFWSPGIGLALFLVSCASTPKTEIFPKSEIKGAFSLGAESLMGNSFTTQHYYKSEMEIEKKNTPKKNEVEWAEFEMHRKTVGVVDSGEIQFQKWITNKKGDAGLHEMGVPEEGETLLEVVDPTGQPLYVKSYPRESIFYLPSVSLPKTKVKPGDKWTYKGSWKGLKSGLPFNVVVRSKLKGWVDCEGQLCAHVLINGEVRLPKDFPIPAEMKGGFKGEYYFKRTNFEVLYTYVESKDSFHAPIEGLKINSKSFTCVEKKSYNFCKSVQPVK